MKIKRRKRKKKKKGNNRVDIKRVKICRKWEEILLDLTPKCELKYFSNILSVLGKVIWSPGEILSFSCFPAMIFTILIYIKQKLK